MSYLAVAVVLAAGACVVLLGTRSSGETMPHEADPLAPAKVAIAERDYARAEDVIGGLLKADPKNVHARLLMGRALLGRGRLGAARETFSTLLQDNKDSFEAARGLAETYEALGQPDLAAALWRRAAALKKDAEPHLRLARVLSKSDFAGAMAALQEARSLEPGREDIEPLFQEILAGQTAPGSIVGGTHPGNSFPHRPLSPNPRALVPPPQPPDPAKHFPQPGGTNR